MKKTALALIALTSLVLAGCGWEEGDNATTPEGTVNPSALADVPTASATPTATSSASSTPAATSSSSYGATATPSASSSN